MTNAPDGLYFYFWDASLDSQGQRLAFCFTTYPETFKKALFLQDLLLGTTTFLSTNGSRPQFRADGRYLSYCDGYNVLIWDSQLQTNLLVSVSTNGYGPANGKSQTPSISSDGHRVIFLSSANDLVTNTVNGNFQLYVRDLVAGTTRLVSANTNGLGTCTDLESIVPVISTDGRLVAFDSAAEDLVPGDLNQASDVFVRDLSTETTTLVSERADTLPPSTDVAYSTKSLTCISSNAQFVAFTAADGKLVPNDTNGVSDPFVRDLLSGSIQSAGLGDYPAGDVCINANGRFIAYTRRLGLESWSNFGAGDIYRYDLQTGSNILVTVSTNGTPVGWSSFPAISPDGRYVAFQSRATNLVALAPSSRLQIYMRDVELGSNILVSVGFDDTFGNEDSRQPIFSSDGRWLLFRSLSRNLFSYPIYSELNGALFARDMRSNTIVWVSSRPYDGSVQDVLYPNFSSDSRYVTFSMYTRHEVWVRDLINGTNCLAIRYAEQYNTVFYNPVITSGGHFVVYEQRDLYNFLNRQIVLTDLQAMTTNVISINKFGTAGGNNASSSPQITPDGQFVVFASKASDLVDGDTNGFSDIFVRDRLRNVTMLVSVNPQGQPGNGPSTSPVLAGDGRTVVFQSLASDLVQGDYNMKRDLFVLRLSAGDTDGDGMDDDWEMAYFGTLARDGTGDFDGDGSTDKQEFLAGTDPTNAGSVLRAMTLTPVGGGNIIVLWPAAPGRLYKVQYRDNIEETVWHELPGSVNITGATASLVDPSSSSQPHRFYRVLLQN